MPTEVKETAPRRFFWLVWMAPKRLAGMDGPEATRILLKPSESIACQDYKNHGTNPPMRNPLPSPFPVSTATMRWSTRARAHSRCARQ